ncbi:shikimate kinase AroK [uncultured Psychrobacter sp.]|uniref:shikimate kinase AroK n=1 Tax=uncultured Psychrobacter sp. TaxID=259303 RepID=UPI00345741BE
MREELPSVFLVGPMGAGKTTIGRLLAKQLGREFVDSDWYIESQTGADIAWIFAKEGESGFRARETRAIDELTKRRQIVLATGGGAVMSADNRKFLHERGIVVYLNAPVEVQIARTSKDKSRPLLQKPNPKQILQDLYHIRDPLYQQIAHIILPTGHTYPRHMVNKLLQQLESFFESEHTRSIMDTQTETISNTVTDTNTASTLKPSANE